jgi:hypothetical protein
MQAKEYKVTKSGGIKCEIDMNNDSTHQNHLRTYNKNLEKWEREFCPV